MREKKIDKSLSGIGCILYFANSGVDEEKIREQKYGSRRNKKFTLNLMSEDIEEQTLQNFIEENRVEEKVVEKENRKELLFYNEGLDVSKNIRKF